MRLNIRDLLRERGVTYTTGGKNGRPGWIQTRCPFCDDRSDHLGFCEADEYWRCWRCGWHSLNETVSVLTSLGWKETKDLILRHRNMRPVAREAEPERPSSLVVPGGEMAKIHRAYLEKRGYDPDDMFRRYGLLGTGPVGSFRFRIVAPIYADGRAVCYQGRDVTGRQPEKYKACPNALAITPMKETLFAMDDVPGDSVAIVEGMFDQFRLGPGSVATFGVQFTPAQVLLLARRWRRRFVLYDPDARDQARKLALALAAFPGETMVADIDEKDPGEMSPSDAAAVMRDLNIR